MLQLNNITYRRDTEFLIQDSSLTIGPQHKVGIIGPNGCGKSSLFAILRGELALSDGDIHRPKQWRLSFMAQIIADLDISAHEYVLKGYAAYYEVHQALAEAEAQEDWESAATLHQTIDHHQWYQEPARALQILHGLGFSTQQCQQPVKSLSGGWRVRMALARALFAPSDCLLLDEPTNHLDIKTLLWLEQYLHHYTGCLLMISHDAAILDAVCSHTLAFESGKLVYYTGAYSRSMRLRAERLALQQKTAEKQEKKVAHLMSFVDRFRAKASKAKQAQSRLKQIEKMEVVAKVQAQTPFSFSFEEPTKVATPIVRLTKANLGYKDKTVLRDVNLYLGPGDRVAFVGENGAGKSTMAKSIVGELLLLRGEYHLDPNTIIGYFAQHQLELLPTDKTPLKILREQAPKLSEQHARSYLGQFNFSNDMVFQDIQTLSGGEKARLVLALIIIQKPSLLILDEPTNHLDLEMREALSLALQTYMGAAILISHDRTFLSQNVDSYYHICNGQCVAHDNFDDIDFKASASKSTKAKNRVTTRAERQKRQNRFKKLDTLMAQVHAQLHDIEKALADSGLYENDDHTQYEQLMTDKQTLVSQLEAYEAEWLEISEQLED